MTAIICIVIFVCSLLALLIFGCSVFLCIIALAASAALFAADTFLFKEAKLKRILMPVLTGVLIVFCLFIPVSPTGYGYYDYLDLLKSYSEAEAADKTDKANKRLAELTERYGETDDSLYVRALMAVERGAPDEAEELAGRFSDKTTEKYFTVMEKTLVKKHEFSDDITDLLIDLYEKEAECIPDSIHANETLGMLLLDKKEYEKATYYLLKAYESYEEPNGQISYYLGVALIEQEQYSEGFELFRQAIDLGVDDESLADISYYIEQASADKEVT